MKFYSSISSTGPDSSLIGAVSQLLSYGVKVKAGAAAEISNCWTDYEVDTTGILCNSKSTAVEVVQPFIII